MNLSSFFALISFIIILSLSPGRYTDKDDNFIFIVCLLSIINTFLYLYHTRKFYKNWLRADLFFLVGFLIVHFQIPFLSTFGIEPLRGDYIWVNKKVVNYATELSAYALLFWIVGAHLFNIVRRYKKKKVKEKNYIVKESYLYNIIFGVSLIIWIGTVGTSFWGGSHAGVYNWGTGATYAFLIMRTMLTLSIIYLFINNKGKFTTLKSFFFVFYKNKLLFTISILYCLIFLFVGDRGPVIQLGLTFLGGYVSYNNNISFRRITLFIVIGSFFLTIIGLGRTSNASDRDGNILTEGFNNLVDSNETIIPTEELASSVRIQYLALDWIPDRHPYLNGLTIWSNLIGVIPFGSQLVDIPPVYQNSTSFFTITEKGEDFQFGLGSEIIA